MKQERLSDILLASFFARLIVWCIAAAAFLPGLLRDPAHAIAYYHDEHNILLHEEAARKTIADFHQLPSWNPYFCGGMPGLANPPDTSLSPDFVLRLIFGTQPGRKLAALLMVLLGMEGTFRLARRHQASVIGAAMGGVAFACSGHFNYLAGLGWLFMFAYQLIPWVALSFEEGLRDIRWRVGGGLFIAWMVLSGGTYVTLYAGIVLLCLLVIETVRAVLRSDGPDSVPWHRPAVTLATMGVVSFGVTAVRVLPMLQIVRKFPRILEQHDSDSPFVVLARLAVGHGERASAPGRASSTWAASSCCSRSSVCSSATGAPAGSSRSRSSSSRSRAERSTRRPRGSSCTSCRSTRSCACPCGSPSSRVSSSRSQARVASR
ncbi:MAG: hypothetical protein IPJ34_16375 [Myxococcales bacterium]|nr:hypothetical protein [Myxococcales bacterium]